MWILIAVIIAMAGFQQYQKAEVGAAITPEQRAAEAKQMADDKKRALAVLVAAGHIKKSAREPDKVAFVSLRASDDARVVCTQYRGRNGFGGVSEEFLIFVGGLPVNAADNWKKYCKGSMYEYKDTHQHLIKSL